MRIRLVCDSALKRAAEIRSDELEQIVKEDEEVASSLIFEKNTKQVETLAKLTMQKLVLAFRALDEEGEQN